MIVLMILAVLLPIGMACLWRGLRLTGEALNKASFFTILAGAALAALCALIPDLQEVSLRWTD
ncbi:MAG: hypothetical protein IJI53_06540, partial [Clostridia bacterium]|nr:hypothetical protein [Clostridia bacterium]